MLPGFACQQRRLSKKAFRNFLLSSYLVKFMQKLPYILLSLFHPRGQLMILYTDSCPVPARQQRRLLKQASKNLISVFSALGCYASRSDLGLPHDWARVKRWLSHNSTKFVFQPSTVQLRKKKCPEVPSLLNYNAPPRKLSGTSSQATRCRKTQKQSLMSVFSKRKYLVYKAA